MTGTVREWPLIIARPQVRIPPGRWIAGQGLASSGGSRLSTFTQFTSLWMVDQLISAVSPSSGSIFFIGCSIGKVYVYFHHEHAPMGPSTVPAMPTFTIKA
jgi:hypothetical protein